jgi:hypothetical protein
MHLFGYLYEDYHDEQSLEHKVKIFGLRFPTEEGSLCITTVVRPAMLSLVFSGYRTLLGVMHF